MRFLLLSIFLLGCDGGRLKDKPAAPKPAPIAEFLVGSSYLPSFVESWELALITQGYTGEEMPFSDGLVTDPAKVMIEWRKITEGAICRLYLQTTIKGEYVTSSSTCEIQ